MTTRTKATSTRFEVLVGASLLTLMVGCGSNQVSIGEQNADASVGGASGSGARCGGPTGSGCSRDQFCERSGGCFSTSDDTGTCLAIPHSCFTNYVPVCGCDGRTYGNDCERQVAGVSKASDGPCNGTGGNSGSGGISAAGGNMGSAGASSIILGGNSLLAGSSAGGSSGGMVAGGASLLAGSTGGSTTGGSRGSVAPDDRCGGVAGLKCSSGSFCDYGSCAVVISDAMGICVVKPQSCIQNDAPVCGCDGKSYSNDCLRRLAGVGKASDGACGGTGGTGGTGGKTATGGTGGSASGGTTGSSSSTGKLCSSDVTCGAGAFCDFPTLCGGGDHAGNCVNNSGIGACLAVWQPLCGCNGKTYGNECERQRAGVSKRSDGECPNADGGVSDAGSASAALCDATGGEVTTQSCCSSVSDFPDFCVTGSCGCAPTSSHVISVCSCPNGCFIPGTGCVGNSGTCTVGVDHSCNDNPNLASIHGRCVTGGRCVCTKEFPLLANGKCL